MIEKVDLQYEQDPNEEGGDMEMEEGEGEEMEGEGEVEGEGEGVGGGLAGALGLSEQGGGHECS